MTGRYNLKVITEFAAAHRLRDYEGACSQLHGHNWKVEIEAEATSLNELGMAIDFKLLKEAARAAVNNLDHRVLNEVTPFDRKNPTAENLAAYLYEALRRQVGDSRIRVAAVTVWENDRACVRYIEEN
ncbi:MAG: 6-carboxytetrahydropterin synthase QueD [Gammaproteobacteria bacterium]|nr:6-carboxytetrahydropterin synthase QueD [Gammaproteobacteria bacterium]